jgi:hypothetical protein
MSIAEVLERYESEHQFARQLLLPEEDRIALGIPWTGGYRWFRSSNVICLEKYRRLPRREFDEDRH